MLGWSSLIYSRVFEHSIGKSVEQRDIVAKAGFDFSLSPWPDRCALLIGGIHGDEAATVHLLESFVQKEIAARDGTPSPTVVVALANPDSHAHNTRYNARGVDINRNFEFNWNSKSVEPSGPEPWSEPETRALRDLVLKLQPAHVVSLHWALAEIDADGPQSADLARRMWESLDETERRPYRVRIGEPGDGSNRQLCAYEICPGSLGQWCGYGLRYVDGSRPAMITLELPYDPDAESCLQPPPGHLDCLRERWRRDRTGYLKAVESGVHKMLRATIAPEID